jgi:hypothetical protein
LGYKKNFEDILSYILTYCQKKKKEQAGELVEYLLRKHETEFKLQYS